MPRKLTTKEFIKKAKLVHCDKYDYDKVVYTTTHTKVIITCPIDGDFEQTPNVHLNGSGCQKCAIKKSQHTSEIFINRAKQVHGNKYDYSKTMYKSAHSPVTIGCPVHGNFSQMSSDHLSGYGCSFCAQNKKLTTKEFIKKSKQVHGNKYDYSKTVYKGAHMNVIIICPVHGEFKQTPSNHLNGCGCNSCYLSTKPTTETFVDKAKVVHKNRYDYSKVFYVNSYAAIIIICRIHGEFLQTPNQHLAGSGCPDCQKSKGELLIAKTLDENGIQYIKQKTFVDCINPKTKYKLKYDFYISQRNALIEFNGIQHYECVKYWHKNNQSLKNQQYRDSIKKSYALKNGYKFLVIKYSDNIEEILNKEVIENNKSVTETIDSET
jgi:hypothetical protein